MNRVKDKFGATDIFAQFDREAEKKGLVGVPIVRDDKVPAIRGWQKFGAHTPEQREALRRKHASCQIGLLAGTKLPNGRLFGFVDVDHDGFVDFARTFFAPIVSGKVGAKGLTIFFQAEAGLKSKKLKARRKKAHAVELFISSGQGVVPPSRHPSGNDYRWEVQPLWDIDLTELPVLDKGRYGILELIVRNEHAWAIVEGGPDIKAHNHMLALTASGIALMTHDLEWLADSLNALFHPAYSGNTKSQTLEMLKSAAAKKLGAGTSHYDPGEEGPIPLGYTKEGGFAVRDQKRGIIIIASANQLLSFQFLIGLASSEFWRGQYPTEKSFSCHAAGEALLKACRKKGPFDPLSVRGRGIWREGDKTIVNLGGIIPPNARLLYLCFDPIPLDTTEPFDAPRLLALLQRFKWHNPLDAKLLFGWLAVAPICGVLTWRPHCFLFGPARCGKTTVHTVVTSVLRPLVVSTDGQSSEAGIRQRLGPDSLPVVIDEFESDQSGAGLRGVLRLARSASSADSTVLRGTPEGKAMQFCLQTCFMFCAVNPSRMTPADQTRITLLRMMMHDNDREVGKAISLDEAYFRDRGPDWCARMIALADKIQPAIDLVEAALPSFDRRHRQNMATLVGAGFVALHERVPTAAEAQQLAEEFGGTIALHEEDINRDDARECLDYLLTHVVEKYPLWHWIGAEQAALRKGDKDPGRDSLRVTSSFGITVKVDGDNTGVFTRNRSPAVERVFRDHPKWEQGGWLHALRKLDEAFHPKDPIWFRGVGKCRCIGLPLDLFSECLPERWTDF